MSEAPTPPPPRSRHWEWLAWCWSAGQFAISLGITIAVLIYLLNHPGSKSAVPETERKSDEEPVAVVGPMLIRVKPDSPIGRKFQVADIQPSRITAPLLTVTGTVVASLRPSPAKVNGAVPAILAIIGTPAGVPTASDYWQFNAPEALTAFTDWQRAKADIAFATTQLAAVTKLAAAKFVAQTEIVKRLEKSVVLGTDPKMTLDIARNDLTQVELNGQKDIHEAQNALLVAQRNEAATSLQLQQLGLDPALLISVTSDVDIVMADVPESLFRQVKIGQGCDARFFGIPDTLFTGRVKSFAQVISKERRSLRVLFTIDDLNDRLRPGLFAEIGLGTDAREALLAPAEGVVHIGRSDYLLVAAGEPGAWRVTQVEVGEMRDGKIEVIKGLEPGNRVLGEGAILLKPAIARCLPAAMGGGL